MALIRRKPDWNVDNVKVDDLGPEYVKVTYAIKKTELKKAIWDGIIPPPEGAELKSTESLVKR